MIEQKNVWKKLKREILHLLRPMEWKCGKRFEFSLFFYSSFVNIQTQKYEPKKDFQVRARFDRTVIVLWSMSSSMFDSYIIYWHCSCLYE